MAAPACRSASARRKSIAAAIALVASLPILVAGSSGALAQGATSQWESDFGTLTLAVAADRSVSGRYATSNGAIDARLSPDGTITGIWIQSFAWRSCAQPRGGSHYWGRVDWQVRADRTLRGSWSYCDDPPGTGGGWDGTFVSGTSPLAALAAPAPRPPPVVAAPQMAAPPVAAPPSGTAVERRVALVIGNGAYRHAAALQNPPGDARLMVETLRASGFEVLAAIDADQTGMKRAIQQLGERLALAAGQPGIQAIGLFFYAGHGIQARGRNYLVPVDARLARESDLEIEAVAADWAVAQMEDAQSRLNLVILDACRNNPFARGFRSALPGLARMDAPAGTLVAYATAPGEVAADGSGANSPYTQALADAIGRLDAPVEQLFKQVRIRVKDATGGAQVPWEASSLTGDFYFARRPAPASAPPAATATPSAEVAFWQSIQASRDAADYDDYLKQFPDGVFASLARRRAAELRAARPQ